MRLYNCGFKNMDMFALCIDLGQKYFASKVSHYFRKKQIGKMNTQLFHSALGVATFEHPMKSFKKSRQWTENCYSIQYPTKQLRLFN